MDNGIFTDDDIEVFFPDIIGQEKVKRQLAFYIKSFESTSFLPHLLILGGKGGGKTALATLTAKSLRPAALGGKPKPLLKVNCATVRKLESLVENVFNTYVKDNHITVFFDECHALDDSAQEAMLTALNQSKDYKGYINYRDSVIEFDFKKVSFIFATTDPQLMNNPLKDRLRHIQLSNYTHSELAKIIKINAPGLDIEPAALDAAASVCRGNPRSSVKMAQENIVQFCGAKQINKFDFNAWLAMKELLGINNLGVSESELQILNALDGIDARSLTSLAACTGMEKGAIQHEHEKFLMKLGLIEVVPKGRRLTSKGQQYINLVKATSQP